MFVMSLMFAACLSPQINVEFVPQRVMTRALEHTIVTEADHIWSRHGINVREGDGLVALSVRIVSDGPSAHGAAAWNPLGAVSFFAKGRPDRHISLFYDAAIDLIADARWPGEAALRWIVPYQLDIVGRVLGRALAHEIGHYLLRTPEHSGQGLMRAHQPIAEMMAEDGRLFELTPSQAQRALQEITGGSSQAEVASGSCQ
jgi:hypothetical protein